jgi:hypothetical protein
MKWIKDFYKLEKPSLLILVLPYIAIYWNLISENELFLVGNSNLFSYPKMGFILLFILLIDLVFKYKANLNSSINKYLVILTVTIFILFFYADLITHSYLTINNMFVDLNLKGRWFFLFYFIFIFLLQLFFLKKNSISYKIINFYFFVFFCIILASNVYKNHFSFKNIDELKNRPIVIKVIDYVQKPIILIITDEYSSPEEILKITKNSSVYEYSDNLKKQGWIIKNSFYSYETETKYCLSSLFNFNLSANNKYSNQPDFVLFEKFSKCNLYDSIYKKQGNIINLGIYNIGKSRRLTDRLFPSPENFVEKFLIKSFYFVLKSKFSGEGDGSFMFSNHNEMVFNRAINISLLDNKTFVYTHLVMPHPPFVYNNEFKMKEINTHNYIDFWNFSNTKTMRLLKVLTKGNKFRIIITGDHGYRRDKRINPHNTFAAFYGFEKESVDKMQSVQDLGSLINAYM